MTTLRDIALDGTGLGLTGRAHDADLGFPEMFDFDDFAKTSSWAKGGASGFTNLEWRGAVIPEQNQWPSSVFNIDIAYPECWILRADGQWVRHYDVVLTGTGRGAYLGLSSQPQRNPFTFGQGVNTWTKIGDEIYRTPWKLGVMLLHFWAGRKATLPAGYLAEFSCGAIRVSDPNVKMLGGIGADYYPSSTTNNHKAPGPGIQRYKRLGTDWTLNAWVSPSATANVPYTHDAMKAFLDKYGTPNASMMKLVDDSPVIVTPVPDLEPVPDPSPIPVIDPAPTNDDALARIEKLERQMNAIIISSDLANHIDEIKGDIESLEEAVEAIQNQN